MNETEASSGASIADRRASGRRQILLLVTCQALLYVNDVAQIAINGLAGLSLAPSPLWATLPITTYIVGSALTTVPASFAMARFGRRAGFVAGALFGLAGMSIAAAAMFAQSFVLLCLGTFIVGGYNAFASYLRFAAADVADAYDPSIKERAIAWVLAGGIAGGIIGPELSKLTRDLLPAAFAGTYIALAVTAAIAALFASRLHIPATHAASAHAPARPLARIAAQPAFIVAVLIGAFSYGVMSLLMTATPLAMKVCGFGYPQSADVIMWHVIAMFAPGFFTGSLIQRFGAPRVILAGCALMLVTVGVAHHGITYWHFWSALALVGLGWNFMYTAATSLLTTTYTPGEKAKVQGFNDLVTFVTTITSSAASGALLSATGWLDLNLYALPFIALATVATLWLLRRGGPASAPARA